MDTDTVFHIDGLPRAETYAPLRLDGEETGYEAYPVGSSVEHDTEATGKVLLLDTANPITPEAFEDHGPEAVYRGLELHSVRFGNNHPDAYMDENGVRSGNKYCVHLYGKPVVVSEEEHQGLSWNSDQNTEHIASHDGLIDEWVEAEKFFLNPFLDEREEQLLEGFVRGMVHGSYGNTPGTAFSEITDNTEDYLRPAEDGMRPRPVFDEIGAAVDTAFNELQDAYMIRIHNVTPEPAEFLDDAFH